MSCDRQKVKRLFLAVYFSNNFFEAQKVIFMRGLETIID